MTRFAFEVGHLKTPRMMKLHEGRSSLFKNHDLYAQILILGGYRLPES